MRDKVKRFISILMTALMLVNLLPVGALAEGVKISNSVQSIGWGSEPDPKEGTYDNEHVYVYVQIVGANQATLDKFKLNSSGWYTIGSIEKTMPGKGGWENKGSYFWPKWEWVITPTPDDDKTYQPGEETGAGVLPPYSTAGLKPWKENKLIPLDDGVVTWTRYKFTDGANGYQPNSVASWHMDGIVDFKKINIPYTVKHVVKGSSPETVLKEETKYQKYGQMTEAQALNFEGYKHVGEIVNQTIGDDPITIYVYYEPDDTTVPVTYETSEGGTLKGNTKQSVGKVTGETLTDVEATPNTGYNFVGWYKGSDKIWENPILDAATAKGKLNSTNNGYKLYQATTFTAKFVPDTDLKAEVTYEAVNGTVTHASDTILQADASGLTGSTATPNPGYKFDGWYKGDERITTDLTLTPEKAKDELNKDENGLYVNTTFTAKCVLDEAQNATVTYTIFHGQSDYGSIDPSAPQIILQATGKQANGNPISGSTATAKPGYKFAGWYKVTGWTTEWITEWITDKPELTPELAEQNLTRNEQGLYQNTVFAAKFELDENDQAEVIYQVENGTILNTSGSTSISQFVQVVTGEVLTDVTATPNPGYKFDGWYKGDERITTDLTLTPEMAKDKLDKDENGLYVNTTFTAKCVLDEDQNATVLCTIDKTQIGYGTVYPSIYQTILQATGKLANGDPISGSMATANPGYKFVGWYKVTGEETYEKVTDDPELTSELAESKLNRDEKTGLYQNTVFVAWFEPDAGAKVPVTYEAENGTLEGTTSQEAQVVTGEGLTDVEATPNKGYKFDGWYAVDKNGDKHLISGLDPAEKLDAKTAKENLNKDGNLYAETTFIARFVPDENQTVPVIYTTDENGILWGGPAIGSITYNVNIATGKVWLNNAFVDKLEPVPTYPKEGYEFDRWIRVFPEKTIEDASSTLTDEKARPNLNQEDGLYQKTEFKAIFKPQTNLSYTVNYYWNGTEIPVKPSKTVLHQTFGAEATESPIGADDYTPVSNEPKKIKIGADSTQNVINFYYYRNVKLTANSDMKTYNGEDQSVSGYTCAVAEKQQDGSVEYVPWTGEKPLIFDGISASGSGKDVNEKGYQVTFNESPIGEHDDLYYVKESQTGILMITPAPVTLQAPIASKTYDGTPLKAEDYGHSFVEGLDFADDFASISVEGSQTLVGSSASSVTYELKQGKIPNNYNIQCIPGTLTITPVTDEVLVEIKGNTASVTYDGKLHSVKGYAVDSISNTLYTANDFTYNGVAKAEGTDAATYPMNLAETRFENTNPNFENVRFDVVEDGQLVINPRPVVLTSADLTKVYDGTALENGNTPVKEEFGTEKAFPENEGLEYDFTGSQTDVGKSENTFTYTAKDGTNTKLTNYDITTKFGTLEVTPVTDKVTVTIKGGKSSVTYNGEEHTVSGYKVADISNPLYTENDFSFSGTAEAKGKNAGTYKMGLKAADFANTSNNFKNVEFVVADGQLEITKRPVMLTSADLTKVYDGTALTNGDTPVKEEFGTEDAFPDGEGVTYTFKGSQTNAGSSKNMFTYAWNEGTNKDNYTIYQVEGDLVVTPIDGIKVTITGHKDTQTYDGKEHSVFGFDAEPSNALYNPKEDMQFNGTDVDMIAKGTDAGQYNIGLTAEHFTNKSNNFTNVTFVVTDGYVKINPRAVTLTSETAGKTYDGTALEKPVVTVGGDGFVEGQAKEIKATGSVTNAGSVANTITFTPDKETFKEGNYAITKNEGTLTVAKRSVLLTSQSATKTYDGSALTRPAVTITGDGFVPGELAKVEATGSITNVGSTPNAIQYTTTGAFNPANYSIALSVGTLTVTAKPEPEPRRTFNLTVNYVYQNGKRAAASYNRGGLKNGETFDITSPVIAGYTASETVVSGTIDNRDIKVTVIYTADGVNLDDYGVPLGLGNITMNVGDCFE